MKKSNKILLGILSFLVVCVVGYALFSEQIVATGTIRGKGDFEVTPTCSLGYSDDLINAGVANSSTMNQKGYDEDSCYIVNGEVQFTTNLDYPGSKRYFTVKVENTGTIPATFDEEKLSSEGLYESIGEYFYTYRDMYGDGSYQYFGSEANFKYYNEQGELIETDLFKLVDAGFIESGNYCSYSDECFNVFESIKTGESFYYILAFEWPEDYAKSFYDQKYNVSYEVHSSMEIPFRQTTLE